MPKAIRKCKPTKQKMKIYIPIISSVLAHSLRVSGRIYKLCMLTAFFI